MVAVRFGALWKEELSGASRCDCVLWKENLWRRNWNGDQCAPIMEKTLNTKEIDVSSSMRFARSA